MLDFPTWMAQSQLAPYIVERKAGGSLVSIFDSMHPALDVMTAATPNLVIVQNIGGIIRQYSDLGDGLRHRVDPAGSIFAFRPTYANHLAVQVPHHVRTFSWPLEWVCTAFAHHVIEPPSEALDSIFGRPLQSASLHRLLNLLWDGSEDGTAASRLTAEGISLCLLGEMLKTAQMAFPMATGGLPPWAARRCIDHIMDNLDRDVSIGELAALVQLSVFHFARAFRASVGAAPGSFQRSARMKRAQRLLVETQLPVIEVAALVGYETPQAFSRVFRRMVGVTPTYWRRRNRG